MATFLSRPPSQSAGAGVLHSLWLTNRRVVASDGIIREGLTGKGRQRGTRPSRKRELQRRMPLSCDTPEEQQGGHPGRGAGHGPRKGVRTWAASRALAFTLEGGSERDQRPRDGMVRDWGRRGRPGWLWWGVGRGRSQEILREGVTRFADARMPGLAQDLEGREAVLFIYLSIDLFSQCWILKPLCCLLSRQTSVPNSLWNLSDLE